MISGFEKPKIWENRKSVEFRKWLFEQVNLAPENWSPDFKQYSKIREKESGKKEKWTKPSLEEKRNKTFERYLGGLCLTEQDLKDKSILDIGCENGDFAIACLEKGITKKAYGLDTQLEGDAVSSKYYSNFFSEDITHGSPVRNLDYAFSVGAISTYLDEEHKIDAEVSIGEAIRAINENGEVRIWPVKKTLRGIAMDRFKEEERVILEIMGKIEKESDIVWELKPTDIRVGEADKDVWAEQVLIIKRKILE